VSGTGGGSAVVAGVAGRVDETGVDAGGFACGGRVDCAHSDAEKARPATAANRIGAKRCMWVVGRAAMGEVTRRAVANKSTANRRLGWD
jgi:hypothetical protein